jgi:acyl dehydratase
MQHAPHTFDDFQLQASFLSAERVISRSDIDTFSALSGDHTALHTDEAYAATTPLRGLVSHGALNLAVATGQAYSLGLFDGTVLAFRGMEVRFDRPVYPGDAVRLELTVDHIDERPRPDRGRIRFAIRLLNGADRAVLSGSWELLLRRDAKV